MSYIGNSPGVASQRVETAFTATSSQTVFTPSSGYTLGYCDVYQNGVKLVNGDDYTASDGATVTLATGAASGDSIVIVASFPRGLTDGYLKSEADAKYLTIANPSYTGTLSGGTGAITIGTNQFVKDSSGNIGIGTASPGAPLHILSGTQEQIRLGRSSTSSSAYLTFFANNASSAQVQYAGILGDVVSSTAGSHGGALLFYTTGSGTSAERARIDPSGNFGLGTLSPSNYAGYSTITLNNSSGGEIDIKAGNTLYADIYANSTGLFIRSHQNTPMMLWAGGAERARIDLNGNMSLSAGNLSFSSGKGIDFSATANSGGSMSSELLDDYEVGTWTPSLNLLSQTGGTFAGRYVKVGKAVWVQFSITGVTSSDTTQDGTLLLISGLPFTYDTGLGMSSIITERAAGGNYPSSPHTFGVAGYSSTSLVVVDNHYNGTFTNASYYSSAARSLYKGGGLYLNGHFQYFTA